VIGTPFIAGTFIQESIRQSDDRLFPILADSRAIESTERTQHFSRCGRIIVSDEIVALTDETVYRETHRNQSCQIVSD
jgi:hypothetical protein